ncbi:unnamed protein product, partial [Mesorhabditis belari]|uniref:Uncharacterized protein n=1 Tax=Mesorhabditis belari TaxID=2138241 RepID=A0AAF3J9T3_9BILA
MLLCQITSTTNTYLALIIVDAIFCGITGIILGFIVIKDAFRSNPSTSQRTREMQLYFSMILFLQAIILVGCVFAPLTIYAIVALRLIVHDLFAAVGGSMNLFVSFHSTCTSFIVVFATKTYRNAIIDWTKSALRLEK